MAGGRLAEEVSGKRPRRRNPWRPKIFAATCQRSTPESGATCKQAIARFRAVEASLAVSAPRPVSSSPAHRPDRGVTVVRPPLGPTWCVLRAEDCEEPLYEIRVTTVAAEASRRARGWICAQKAPAELRAARAAGPDGRGRPRSY